MNDKAKLQLIDAENKSFFSSCTKITIAKYFSAIIVIVVHVAIESQEILEKEPKVGNIIIFLLVFAFDAISLRLVECLKKFTKCM
jgi:hypothetical protein